MRKVKPSNGALEKAQGKYVPGVSISCVTLCFHSGSLKVLLCKYKISNKWVLPGGLIGEDEDSDEAVQRVLRRRTNTDEAYIKQFYFFGKKKRIEPDDNIVEIIKQSDHINGNWDPTRFISLGYYSFVKYDDVNLLSSESESLKWFDINELPTSVYGDHREIINIAITTIRNQVGFLPIGYELLPTKFTMPELRSIYETILGRELDRRNFQRKMLSIGYIKPLHETRKIGAHKSPNLYTFEKDKYEEAARLGLQIMSNNL